MGGERGQRLQSSTVPAMHNVSPDQEQQRLEYNNTRYIPKPGSPVDFRWLQQQQEGIDS